MGKITNEKKFEAVKSWLSSNKIMYMENHNLTKSLKADLWIPSLMIAIHVGDDDGVFYKNTCTWCKPFFIRESETKAFVLEKIQNCCFDQMVRMQKKFEKKQNKENDTQGSNT